MTSAILDQLLIIIFSSNKVHGLFCMWMYSLSDNVQHWHSSLLGLAAVPLIYFLTKCWIHLFILHILSYIHPQVSFYFGNESLKLMQVLVVKTKKNLCFNILILDT